MKPLTRAGAGLPEPYPERVVQFGAGNFLRGFADWIVDILNEETDFAASIVVVKPTAKGTYDALDKQDCLFHVRLHSVEAGNLETSIRLVSCLSRTVNPYTDFEAYLQLAKQAGLRFVISNTTESGIVFEASDRFKDAPPNSFPAKLTRFLFERFKHFEGAKDSALIILPCELIEDNGAQLKRIVFRYAKQWELGEGFADWLETNTFCNTLVDRIVTGLPVAHETLWQDLGYSDDLIVEGEAYHSWIIEGPDRLKNELPVNKTGLNVQFTRDLSVQREVKVRILNGAHTALVPVGYLYGKRTVDAVVSDDLLYTFVRDLLFDEVIPTLNSPQNPKAFAHEAFALESFARATLNRFENPTLSHTLSAIALNSTAKFRTRLLPSLLAYYGQTGNLPKRIVFAFACLMRFYKGAWQGKALSVQDNAAVVARWLELWHLGPPVKTVDGVLAETDFWGQDLNNVQGLAALLVEDLRRLERGGVRAVLGAL